MNNYIDLLEILNNFGIKKDERLDKEERVKRITQFRKDLSLEKYLPLFEEIQTYLLNAEIDCLEKDKVITLLIEFIRNFPIFEDNINQFPKLIQIIYKSYCELSRLFILLEIINSYEFPVAKEFEKIVIEYFSYLENDNNEFYIHNNFSKIEKFNNNLLKYLEKKDFDGIRFEESIENPELIANLKDKIISLNNTIKK